MSIHFRQLKTQEAKLFLPEPENPSRAKEYVQGRQASQDWQQVSAHVKPHLGVQAQLRVSGESQCCRDEEDVRGCEPPQDGHQRSAHGPHHRWRVWSDAQKKGGKGQKSARKEAVNQLFRDAGVDPNKVNKCLKAGVLNGHVPLTEEGTINLGQVLLKSGCNCCSKELTCTIRDALYQIEYGGNEYEDGGEHAAVQCNNEEEFDGDGCGGNFITGLCNGDIHFDSGKFHNHCGKCANFGHCIGDYRSRCNGKPGRSGKGRTRWVGFFGSMKGLGW